MDRIHLLHIVGILDYGGAEYGVVFNLLNNLDKDKYRCSLISLTSVNVDIEDKLSDDVNLYCIDKRKGLISAVLQLRKYVKNNNVDIIHTHNWSTYLFGFLCLGFNTVKRFFHTEHGRDSNKVTFTLKRSLAQKFMYKFTTRIIAVSQDIADFIPKAWGVDRSKILCIKNSVYSDKYHIDKENRDIKKSDLGISNEKLVIGTVSVLRKVKNHKLLIETFARLYRKYPHLMLVVVGDYPLDDYRNVLIELVESYHLSDSVLFTGARADIPELMNIFDIYVNMSLFEGTSITILEALASGLPVVASDVGGNPELVKDGVTGFLFVSNDIDDFYMKIKKLLDDPSLRADISANAVDFIDSHYSYSKMISSYDGLYTSNE